MPTLESTFQITDGLDCAHCALGFEEMACGLPGVTAAKVHFSAAKIDIAYDATTHPDAPEVLLRRAAQMGYTLQAERDAPAGAVGSSPSSKQAAVRHRAAALLVCLGGLTVGIVADHGGYSGLPAHLAYGVAVVAGGARFAQAGLAALRGRVVGTHLLMTVAAVGAMAIGRWEESAMTVALYTIGLALEGAATERTRRSLRGLIEARPDEALIQRADLRQEAVSAASLKIDDILVIRPGATVAADGVVLSGQSDLTEAAITGEPLPVEKSRGATVFAGSLNATGTLLVRVTAPAADSTVARLTRLVEEAQDRKPPLQSLTERFGRIYTPIVLLLAIIMAVFGPLLAPGGAWLYRALTLLVVACPCALIIATPVAYVSAITRAARDGILVKGGDCLEALAGARAIFFDKTGTLTTGRPRFMDMRAADGQDEDALLYLAASVERRSEHPIARAIEAEAIARHLAFPPVSIARADALPGYGIGATLTDGSAVLIGRRSLLESHGVAISPDLYNWVSQQREQGMTTLCLSVDGAAQSVFAVADAVRPEAALVIADLRQTGHASTLLTGDNAGAAEQVAQAVGIESLRARLLPADKLAIVEAATATQQTVFVGDGINDAPALAAATIGIALGAATGTAAAMEAADIVLMRDDLRLLPQVMRLAHATHQTVRVNVALSLGAVAALLIATVLGHVSLPIGVLAHEGSALLVILNGLRLLAPRKKGALATMAATDAPLGGGFAPSSLRAALSHDRATEGSRVTRFGKVPR